MMTEKMSLRRLAKVLGVSQPFLSQIKAGKRPMPERIREKVVALDAYHLLITSPTDKQNCPKHSSTPGSPPATVVGGRGLEPLTSAMSRRHSNQLS